MKSLSRLAGVLGGAAALFASLLPGAVAAEVPPDQVPQQLEVAIRANVEARGQTYAGLCRVVNQQPQVPFGQWCAFVLSIEHDIAEVSVGRVASDELHRVNFRNSGGTWTLVSPDATPTAPAGGTASPTPNVPAPPRTGSGPAGTSTSQAWPLFALGALAVAGGAMGVSAARRK